jgi:hypothetical protein
MEFYLIKENEDGSADYQLHLEDEETQAIVRSVLMRALIEAAKEGTFYDPSKLDMGDTTSGGEDSVHGSCEQSIKSGSTSDSTKAP